jgi:hypothetical protein
MIIEYSIHLNTRNHALIDGLAMQDCLIKAEAGIMMVPGTFINCIAICDQIFRRHNHDDHKGRSVSVGDIIELRVPDGGGGGRNRFVNYYEVTLNNGIIEIEFDW